MKITQFCKVRERIEGVYSVYNLNLGNKEYELWVRIICLDFWVWVEKEL